MTETNIAPCPNPECGAQCYIIHDGPDYCPTNFQVVCSALLPGCCGYHGPITKKSEEHAIRLHNALCRSDALVKELEALEAALRAAEKELKNYIPMLQPNVRKQVATESLSKVQSALAVISKHRKGT